MNLLEVLLALGMAAGYPAIGLWIARRDRQRTERLIAQRPIANRYADHGRVWR